MFLKCGVLFLRPGTRSSVTGEACAVLQSRVETTAKSSSQSHGLRQRSGAAAARSPVTGMFTKCFNGIIFCCASLRSQAEQFV